MGTHIIPREVSGEGRILYIFTPKGIMYTLIGIAIGSILKVFFTAIGVGIIGWAIMALLGLIGWAIGQGKIPDSSANAFFRKVGGESIETIILRRLKFNKSKKIYITKVTKKKEQEEIKNT